MKHVIGTLFAALLLVGVVLYTAFSWGYVAHTIYGWFILPKFPTFPHFTVVEFIGLKLFTNCFIPTNNINVKSELLDNAGTARSMFLGPWILLIIALLIKTMWF